MKRIGLSTVYTGFNYGSCLQAYATKTFLINEGFDVELLSHKSGLTKGRDIRLKKIITIFLRSFWRPNLFKKTFFTYNNSLKKEVNLNVKDKFFNFYDNNIHPTKMTYREMKKFANHSSTVACVCGSDQIWNATNLYVDPVYYLQYAPRNKRIAYAPSFGKNNIPDYNRRLIKKYLKTIPSISTREVQGTELVEELIERKVPSVLDPTLLLNQEEWSKLFASDLHLDKRFVLLYFLDKPSDAVNQVLQELSKNTDISFISISQTYSSFAQYHDYMHLDAGPEEFLYLINNADFVCTDSFHGMVFSINFNTPFYIFKRQYGSATDQSSRIISLLSKLNAENRYITDNLMDKNIISNTNILSMNFNVINQKLSIERELSINYLLNAIKNVESNSTEY